MFVLDVFVPR